jgi:hypothetical protein
MHEGFRGVHATMKLETHHATIPVKQSLSSFVLGVIIKTRIVHLGDRGMTFQELRDSQRASILMLYTNRQCLHSPVQKKSSMRIEATSKMIQSMSYLLNQTSATDNGTGDDVRMSVQVFRRAMKRKIEA